jgi:hypothetical protein
VTRFAKPTPDGAERTEPVLSDEHLRELVDLAKRVERGYWRATPGYYPDYVFVTAANDKEGSLDLELKILENGQYVYKRVGSSAGR